MAPEIVPTPVEMSPPVIHGSCYEEASDSDDGSDLEEGDTYLPRDVDEDHSADEGEDKKDTNMGDLNFVYDELKEPLEEPPNMYSGKGPCLRPGVATSFKTAFECVQLCGGMSKLFWRRLTRNSNEYAARNIKNDGSFGGRPWKKIKVEEMIRFCGCVLKLRRLRSYSNICVWNIQKRMLAGGDGVGARSKARRMLRARHVTNGI